MSKDIEKALQELTKEIENIKHYIRCSNGINGVCAGNADTRFGLGGINGVCAGNADTRFGLGGG